jgi:hypothetical protein
MPERNHSPAEAQKTGALHDGCDQYRRHLPTKFGN